VFSQPILEVVIHLLILIMENFLLKIVYYYYYLCFYFEKFFKGLFVNYTPSLSAVFSDTPNAGSSNGHKFINSSFENLRGTSEFPASIGVYDANAKYNVTECFFRNISSTHGSPRAGGFQCNMSNNNNFGYYNVTANTFIEIRTNRSAVQLAGSFLSFKFNNNSFYNVSANAQGGVLKFNKCIYLLFIII
jgi:hypothetical protein